MTSYYQSYCCPKCGESLELAANSLVCVNGHSFDLAKEGYVNLMLANQKNSLNPGDTKEMIVARDQFLNAGYYNFLIERILRDELVFGKRFTNILDIGCGSGFYLQAFCDSLKPKVAIGTDISKEAVKFAAKKYKELNFAVNNSFELSLKEKSFDLVISIFSPFENTEIEKVLANSGIFILVRPGENHFAEIYDVLGMPKKSKTYPEFDHLKLVKTIEVSQKSTVKQSDLQALIQMTPLFWKTKKVDIEKLELPEITFDFVINFYQAADQSPR